MTMTDSNTQVKPLETARSLSETVLTCDDGAIATLVHSVLAEQSFSEQSITCLGPTYVALRKGGQLKYAYWRYETDLAQTLEGVVDQAIALLSSAAPSNQSGIDALELCLTHSYRLVDPKQFERTFANIHRGIRGIEIQYQDRVYRYSPTRMIAGNLSFQKVFQQVLHREAISAQTFIRKRGILQVFEARQVLIHLTPQIQAITLHRGNRIVPLEKLSGEVLMDMTHCMGQWMVRQVQMDGRMIYKYFPSRGEESDANNLIRQFMATLCLIRYARFTQDEAHWALATQNLTFNLKQFYRTEGSLGFVEYDGKVKLGAIALAALAILEYSDRPHADCFHAHESPFTEIFQGLCNTIDHLWQPDGSFLTFYKPAQRNDNQNFYPGEALLFWASLYQRTQDAQLLERCYASFTYYREWHRQHRNPAFIPWHTQAYTLLYRETQDSQFLDFIYEMNDWLLPMQQWESAQYPDVQGRFYFPEHPEYGPPHASSTGVYLEGLVDAYQLATQAGETNRANCYQQAIWRGLRSIRQLQFRDDVDLFYVSKRSFAHGGIRTNVYDNVIRVDNVQHCLMALLKLMTLPEFTQAPAPVLTPESFAPINPPQDAHPLTILNNVSGQDSKVSIPDGEKLIITDGEGRLHRMGEAQSHLHHFKLLDAAVNIHPLLAELEANAQYWLHDTSRQDKVTVQRETNSIYLRSAVKPFPPGITSSNDVHESQRTRMAKYFPTILKWTETVAASLNGELGRVTLVRLAPHGRVYRHVDHGEYYRVRDRYHLVLQSPTGSVLGAGDEWVRMHQGEFWWFNNKAPHEAFNESDDWRIHLIFDVLR
ncbi:MAG: aspartyl/asparaginyl beta-hydroxylase domain-containing protein [Leptolyngbyaceae bacterium]|nr:aspartyl/asparaginyl beta-hydroxylase domain-containing protein [Leptolyngbyaceae bacterium]